MNVIREGRKPVKPRTRWELAVGWLGVLLGPVLIGAGAALVVVWLDIVSWFWAGVCLMAGLGATVAGRWLLK